MKKKVFFAAMVALGCMLTSCLKEDDLEMLRHPIHVTGEFDPVLGIPVGTGQMNMNDLLSSLSANYSGMINDTADVITLEYTMSTSDTVRASSYLQNSKKMPRRAMNVPMKSSPKVEWFTKDTVLSDTVDIDFFEDVEGLDSISLAHVWVDLSVGVNGDISPLLANKVNVTFDSMEIWYKDHSGATKQYINPNLDTFHVYIPDLRDTVMMAFPRMDMASMVNDRPSKMIARYHLKLRVDPSVVTQNIASMPIQDIIDSVGMSYLVYSANMQVKMPLSVRIDNMNYSFNVDMGSGLSSLNLDSILNSIHDGLSSEITYGMFRLVLENGIPLNLNLSVGAYSKDSVLLWTAFNNEQIPAAQTAPALPGDVVEEAVSPTSKTLEVTMNKNDIENFKEATYMKVDFTVNSGNKHVTVKRSDFLNLKAYLQVQPTVQIDVQIH